MLKAGNIKIASTVALSKFFNMKDPIQTELPIVNIAFSGTLDGGLIPGLTVIAGASKSFKTLLSLYCMKAYLKKYPDGIAILYDSEFGITPEYLSGIGIPTERVIHIPIANIEELKFDLVSRLAEIEKNDKVFIMIDSIGNLASKKEVEDAENEKSVADMTRAKSLKQLCRIITPTLTIKNIPLIAINHIYMTQEMFSKPIVSGGTGIYYSANTIFIITKRQVKEGDALAGWEFVINIEKSRYVKEKSKLAFTVTYADGIKKHSALFDLAVEAKLITKASAQTWSQVDPETGEILPPKKTKTIENDLAFFDRILVDPTFKQFIIDKYMLKNIADDEDGGIADAIDEEDED
jgi:RecA/RadA recombinase